MRAADLVFEILRLALVANERDGDDVEEGRGAVILRHLEQLRIKVVFVEGRGDGEHGGILHPQQGDDHLGEHGAVKTRRLLEDHTTGSHTFKAL